MKFLALLHVNLAIFLLLLGGCDWFEEPKEIQAKPEFRKCLESLYQTGGIGAPWKNQDLTTRIQEKIENWPQIEKEERMEFLKTLPVYQNLSDEEIEKDMIYLRTFYAKEEHCSTFSPDEVRSQWYKQAELEHCLAEGAEEQCYEAYGIFQR